MSDNCRFIRIKKLSPLLINQLAAGEVVTRPASVVKELLENAIDAGATQIEVRITQGGMGLIEVGDNGCGIHPEDMVMAITRHATSKVADVANLQGISTLGFRGEALSAIAAVSRLTLVSSHDDSGIGRQLQVAGILADSPKLMPVVHHRGTTVMVKDLYFNVPARRGNLKSMSTEFNHIETIVREVALARSDVMLNLYHEDKKRLSLSAITTDLSHLNQTSPHSTKNDYIETPLSLSRLEQALGIHLRHNALDIALDLSSLIPPYIDTRRSFQHTLSEQSQSAHISGWLWPIDRSQTSHSALPKLLYVNGRLIKEVVISTQLRKLAQSANLDNMGYALYFELPMQWLNINVHPTKQRIKISPLNNIMAHLNHTLSLKLKTLKIIPPTMVQARQITNSAKNSTNKAFIPKNSTNQNLNHDPVYSQHHNASSKTGAVPQTSVQRQVQMPKHSYQKNPLSEPVNNKPSNINVPLTDSTLPYAIETLSTITLPQCLEIIEKLPNITQEKTKYYLTDFATDKHEAPLPWLLFYHQSQYWLISAQTWYANLAPLVNSQILNKNTGVTDATLINQQLINRHIINISQQMSVQDLLVFKKNIEVVLTKNAIAAIDSAQLVALMLSSASNSFP